MQYLMPHPCVNEFGLSVSTIPHGYLNHSPYSQNLDRMRKLSTLLSHLATTVKKGRVRARQQLVACE